MYHVQRIFRSFDCRFIDLSLNITSTTTLHTIAVPLMTQIYHIYSIYQAFNVYVPVQRGNTRSIPCACCVMDAGLTTCGVDCLEGSDREGTWPCKGWMD